MKAYEGYDRRQMRKMTHLERIDGKTVLFDYKLRSAHRKRGDLLSVRVKDRQTY